MRIFPRLLAASVVIPLAIVDPAAAQPVLTVSSPTATPGSPVTLTVTETGGAGKAYALIGSTVGAGFSYAGTSLAVGADVVVLATGTIPGSGSATYDFTPPFHGTTLDRYYVQAVTSFNGSFVPLLASNGQVIRNADSVVTATIGGSTSGGTQALATGANYIMATPSFVATTNATCVVTSSVQLRDSSPGVIGTELGYMRNAIRRNGLFARDNAYGHYIRSIGVGGDQPDISRASIFTIVSGETIEFGAFVNANSILAGGTAYVQTAYVCQ